MTGFLDPEKKVARCKIRSAKLIGTQFLFSILWWSEITYPFVETQTRTETPISLEIDAFFFDEESI